MSSGAAGTTLGGENSVGGGAAQKQYLKRKKSSLGETKIAVLGGEGVGKSALSVRFITKRFIGEYDQTSENKYKYSTILDGEQMAFEVLDTRSVNDDCGAREDVLKWAEGYVLVYSMISRKSFQLLQEVQKRVEEFRKGASIPIVVIGNKADLAHMRQVTREEGQAFAESLGCPFLEVSASEDVTNVTEAFHHLCRDIVEYKRRSRTFFERVFGAFGKEKVTT